MTVILGASFTSASIISLSLVEQPGPETKLCLLRRQVLVLHAAASNLRGVTKQALAKSHSQSERALYNLQWSRNSRILMLFAS